MTNLIPIIDTHIHLWDQKHPELKWVWLDRDAIHPILGNIDAIKSVQFLLDNVWAEARHSGIEGFVHVQAAIGSPNPVTETVWLTEMAKNGPVPMTIIGDSPLGMPGAIKQLEDHMQSPLFVGVRDFNAEPMLASGDVLPEYENSLKFMAENKLVFDLDCEWPNMGGALALARRHPNLQIVLQHIGFPRRRDAEYFNSWKKAINELAQAENVVMKISGLPMTDPLFTKESLHPWAEESLAAFGPDRTVLGSNWPVDRLYCSYATIMDYTREYISSLSIDEQKKVCNVNAKRIYRF
ncbi:MAG: amidohydrolase family protein [Actinomycetes bacterium]